MRKAPGGRQKKTKAVHINKTQIKYLNKIKPKNNPLVTDSNRSNYSEESYKLNKNWANDF